MTLSKALVLGVAASAVAQVANAACADPLAAIQAAMTCVEKEDATCAKAAYNPNFQKFHNGVDTNTEFTFAFWTLAFRFTDLKLDYDYQFNIPGVENQAFLRYVESVKMSDGSDFFQTPSTEYPFSHEIIQYEAAVVTVDDECLILKWDQTGDNHEQDAVTEVTNHLVCAIGLQGCKTPSPTPAHPDGPWLCAEEWYGTNDGCDCECGRIDPDCRDSSYGKLYCNGMAGMWWDVCDLEDNTCKAMWNKETDAPPEGRFIGTFPNKVASDSVDLAMPLGIAGGFVGLAAVGAAMFLAGKRAAAREVGVEDAVFANAEINPKYSS